MPDNFLSWKHNDFLLESHEMSLEWKLPSFPGEIQWGLVMLAPPLLPSPFQGLPFSLHPVCRGDRSWDLLSLLLSSPSGVPATRVPRRTRRAAERQSWLIFVALQESSWGCSGLAGLFTPLVRGGIRQLGGKGRGKGEGLGSILSTLDLPT